jgi:hypothetical protein
MPGISNLFLIYSSFSVDYMPTLQTARHGQQQENGLVMHWRDWQQYQDSEV